MEHLKRELESAHKAVADLPEPLQSQAFGKLVEKILEKEYGSHARFAKSLIPPQDVSNALAEKLPTANVSELMRKLDVDMAKLEDYIEIKGDDTRLLFPTRRDLDLEEIVLFTVVYLSIRSICYGQREIESSKLREAMSTKGVSVQNVSTYLKRYPSLIIHRGGKRGSTNTSYRLTTEGLTHGLEILKQVIHEGIRVKDLKLTFLGDERNAGKRRGIKSTGMSAAINERVATGFFDEFKSINQLVDELRKRGFFNPRQDVDSYLRKVLLGKRLLREEHNGIWEYVLKK